MKILYFILYLFTGLFTIQSLRMFVIELIDYSNSGDDWSQWIFYAPTAVLWALCFII